MAKRRILKKEIAYIAGELFMEALVCKLYMPGVNPDKADNLMGSILDMQDDFISCVGHPGGKENKKLIKDYYRKLRADLQEAVNSIGKEIGELSKGEQA